jgi:hypothetical protein
MQKKRNHHITAAPNARALDLLKAIGILRLKGFIAKSIEPETLARLVGEEQIIRPARSSIRNCT